MMFWYGGNNWWGYAGMGIEMVVFWALLIRGIVQILAARYAKGELTETEYRDRLTILRT